MSAFIEILKRFQVITIKLRRFRLRKCYFGVLAVKYKQSDLSQNVTRTACKDKSTEYIYKSTEYNDKCTEYNDN